MSTSVTAVVRKAVVVFVSASVVVFSNLIKINLVNVHCHLIRIVSCQTIPNNCALLS